MLTPERAPPLREGPSGPHEFAPKFPPNAERKSAREKYMRPPKWGRKTSKGATPKGGKIKKKIREKKGPKRVQRRKEPTEKKKDRDKGPLLKKWRPKKRFSSRE